MIALQDTPVTEGNNSLVMKNKQKVNNIIVYQCLWKGFLVNRSLFHEKWYIMLKCELKTGVALGQVDH